MSDAVAASRRERGSTPRRASQATHTGLILLDIAEMPGYDPKVPNGADSVSRGRIYYGQPHARYRDALGKHWGIATVCCEEHGAVLCVAKHEAGAIWRCPACNEGAFAPNVLEEEW